jgi:hypothetical protein
MKNLNLVLLGILSYFSACSQTRVLFQELTKAGGLIYYQSKPFTGKGFSLYYNNKVEQEIEFKNGKQDGKTINFYKDGKIKFLSTYKENTKNGPSESYDESGAIISKGNFKNGKADGQWIGWINYGIADAGQPIYLKATFLEGKRVGISIYHNKSNQEITRATYDGNGNLIQGEEENYIIYPNKKIERLKYEKMRIEDHLKLIEEYKKEDSLFKTFENIPPKTTPAGGEILSEGDMIPPPQRKFKSPPMSIELFKKELIKELRESVEFADYKSTWSPF